MRQTDGGVGEMSFFRFKQYKTKDLQNTGWVYIMHDRQIRRRQQGRDENHSCAAMLSLLPKPPAKRNFFLVAHPPYRRYSSRLRLAGRDDGDALALHIADAKRRGWYAACRWRVQTLTRGH